MEATWSDVAKKAAEMGVKPATISKWRQRGVAGAFQARILIALADEGKTVPLGLLAHGPRSFDPTASAA